MHYISNLKIEVTFIRALSIFKDPKSAYNECRDIVNRLEDVINSSRRMDIRYLDPLPGPHIYILGTEDQLLGKIFLGLRGSNVIFRGKNLQSGAYGGVEIISTEVASRAKDMFLESFRMAEKLAGKGGKKRMEQVKKNLDAIYRKHKT